MVLTKSRYTHDNRKDIAASIERLKNDEDYVVIFNILMGDDNNTYSSNSNGVYLNLSNICDSTLDKINKYLNKVNKINKKNIINNNRIYKKNNDVVYEDDDLISNKYKLSNYEKNILKKNKQQKMYEDNVEYETFSFPMKTKSS